MSQHTPGPWYIAERCRWNADVRMIRTFSDSSGTVGVTNENDAALIAAAPELLKALTEIISQIDQGGSGGKVFGRDKCIHAARQVIAKVHRQ